MKISNLLKHKEKNRIVKIIELFFLIVMVLVVLTSLCLGIIKTNHRNTAFTYQETVTMIRDSELEDYDENNKICEVVYKANGNTMIVSYNYEDYLSLESNEIIAYRFENDNGDSLYFDHKNVSEKEIANQYQQLLTDKYAYLFKLAICCTILFISISVIYFFGDCFNSYEKLWFISIMVLASFFGVFLNQDSTNGISGITIMLLYLLDTFLNILCELLISKQSRYNFLVSVGVEIIEILICIVLMYRFATMTTTLFFWLPIDIISFINWSKHKDDNQEELTVVRKLKGYQEVGIILAIVVWTLLVGYILSGLDINSGFIKDELLEKLIIYIDACASAVGVANGMFIFFRLQEQWIAWYICAALETIINIFSGQYILLILKLGYFTNTTYGYLKWSKYIKTHQKQESSLF